MLRLRQDRQVREAERLGPAAGQVASQGKGGTAPGKGLLIPHPPSQRVRGDPGFPPHPLSPATLGRRQRTEREFLTLERESGGTSDPSLFPHFWVLPWGWK